MESIGQIMRASQALNTQMRDFDKPPDISDERRQDALDNAADYMTKFGVPWSLLNSRFDNYNAKNSTQEDVKKYLSEMPGMFKFPILLWGSAGVGKSHLASAMIYKYVLMRIRSRFIVSVDMFSDLRRAFADNESEYYILKKYKQPDILVIDDLGVEKPTDYVRQTWYDILDFRYRMKLPTLITTNLSLDDIATKLDDRIASRMSSGKVFHITGDDYRVQKY